MVGLIVGFANSLPDSFTHCRVDVRMMVEYARCGGSRYSCPTGNFIKGDIHRSHHLLGTLPTTSIVQKSKVADFQKSAKHLYKTVKALSAIDENEAVLLLHSRDVSCI
jgi:hypothetical protein